MPPHQRVSLAPLLGLNSARVSDTQLGGTFMRGGYNVTLKGNEWWTRKGEELVAARLGSTVWRWCLDVNRDLQVICNEFYALAFSTSNQRVDNLYAATFSASVDFTASSTSASVGGATAPTVGQLILRSASGFTQHVYRVTAVSGSGPWTITLERAYENGTETATCRFIDPIARTVAGTTATHSTGSFVGGSAVLFEQLVTYASTDVHAASPAVTGGNTLLIITSNKGVPVAIDVTAYIGGSAAALKRLFFYNTALATPAQIGSDTISDELNPRGVWAEVYKGRLFIAAASDPGGDFGSRTLWYSQVGDCLKWHTGIQGQTAAPNFKTFDGEGNAIAEMKTMQDSIVVHRDDCQEVGNATQSLAAPFTFRTNAQGIGLRAITRRNAVIKARGVHFIMTRQGPAIFDGQVNFIAPEAMQALRAHGFIDARQPLLHVLHSELEQRIYWYSGGGNRHQEALPATADVVFGWATIQNYYPVFVYDYGSNTWWMEDRPYSAGGGMMTTDTGKPTQLVAARIDGTLVAITNRFAGLDADLATPTSTASVYAQVETPWLDFGNPMIKRMSEIEVVFRALDIGSGFFEKITDTADGNYWLRCRVYRDMNRATAKADVGCVYDDDATQLDTAVDYADAGTGLLQYTPRVDGTRFRLVFSNGLTSAATTAGYIQAPFRISDILVEYEQRESTASLTTLNNGSISE